MIVRPIEALYSDDPEIYEAFSADRDFAKQVDVLVALIGREVRPGTLKFLELFAGPAVHAKIFHARGYGTAHAVDVFPSMQQLAKASGGDAIQYHLAKLPDLPMAIRSVKFDIIFAPRYSVGYLDTSGLALMLERCLGMLAVGGLFVLELHDPRTFVERLPRHEFGIQTRTFSTSAGQTGSVTWPYGDLRFSRNGWKAEFTIRLAVGEPGPVCECYYESFEHLHCADLVLFLCRLISQHCVTEILPPMESVFPAAVLTCSRRMQLQNP